MHEVTAKGILSSTNGMNIYRGCLHGCIYCDARSNCYQMDHAFEDIEVKSNAPKLLEEALKRKRNKCMIGSGAMTDPYIPLERKLCNMRRCLEIIDYYEFGVAIQTKSADILRDLDLLKSINKKAKCVVQITLTTYDEELCKIIEPNVSTTKERFEVLNIMKDNGIPTIVWYSPILPYINDNMESVSGILGYCVESDVKGIISFGAGMTLRDGNREYFYKKLDESFPGMKERYIRDFGNSYEIVSPNNNKITALIKQTCKEQNILSDVDEIFGYMHRFEQNQYKQMSLFDI